MTSYDFLVFIRAQTNRRAAMLKHRNLRKGCAFAYVCLFLGHLGSSVILWGPSGVPLKSYGFWHHSVVPLGTSGAPLMFIWGACGISMGPLWGPSAVVWYPYVVLCGSYGVLLLFFLCSSEIRSSKITAIIDLNTLIPLRTS